MSDLKQYAQIETECCKETVAAQIALKRQGRRKLVRHGGTLCSKCYVEPPAPGQRYCAGCHAEAALASYHRKQAELKRLRALAQQQGAGT